jgi:molybdopterin-containing oxidoreductase family membrane subunit
MIATEAALGQEATVRQALAPLRRTTWRFYLLVAALAPVLAFWGYLVVNQTLHGHGVQGGGTKGAIWGILVANVVHLIGISHVGIAISATVRILGLERYKPLARVAELVTLVAMTCAVMNIALDVGRMDRFLRNVVLYGRINGPFVWSCTVITWYVVGSCVYLYLAMRRDLCLAANELPRRRWFYRLLAVGYRDTPEVRARHDRTVWWCAVGILPIMVSVHSVYGFIFGLQSGRPGWFNPIMAPYFVLGAIVSGFSGMIVIAAIVRKVFHWEAFLPPRMFKGLGIFLGFVTWLYMYFLFSELLTGQYNAPHADKAVWSDVLWGRFSVLTWVALIGGLLVPFTMLFVQGVRRKICSIPLTVTAAVMSNLGLWCIRFLIVVPTFYHPHLPYRVAAYVPTFEEWGVMAGSWFFGILFFAVLLKLVPVIELPENYPIRTDRRFVFLPRLTLPRTARTLLIASTTAAGLALIVYGVSAWQADYAPIKWLSGICLLCLVPLEVCLLVPRDELVRRPRVARVSVERHLTRAAPRASVHRYLAAATRSASPLAAPRLGNDRFEADATPSPHAASNRL